MKRIWTLLILMVFTLCLLAVPVLAEDGSNFVEITDPEQQKDIQMRFSLTVKTVQGKVRAFDGFAVREDDWFATYCDGNKKEVDVFDPEGCWQYGFTLTDSGTININWAESGLRIASIRGDVSIIVDASGQILRYDEVPIDMDINPQVDIHTFRMYTVGDKVYKMQHGDGFLSNFFSQRCSQIVLTESDGSSQMIYDIWEQVQKNSWTTAAIAIPVAALFIVGFVRSIIDRYKSGYYAQTRNKFRFR